MISDNFHYFALEMKRWIKTTNNQNIHRILVERLSQMLVNFWEQFVLIHISFIFTKSLNAMAIVKMVMLMVMIHWSSRICDLYDEWITSWYGSVLGDRCYGKNIMNRPNLNFLFSLWSAVCSLYQGEKERKFVQLKLSLSLADWLKRCLPFLCEFQRIWCLRESYTNINCNLLSLISFDAIA